MSYLQRNDYQNITKFFYRISRTKGDFRQIVLQAIEEIFGYRRVTFWLADSAHVLVDPRFHNVEKNIVQAYADQYYQYDPFNYNNLDKRLRKNVVSHLEDIMNPHEYFQENVYYQDVLKQFAYTNKMVIHLKDNETHLGSMSFLRTKNEKPFNARDKELGTIIANYITFLLKKEISIHEIQKENNMLKDIMELDCSGIILFDQDLNVKYMNRAAENYLNRIYALTNFKLEDTFHQMFFNSGCSPFTNSICQGNLTLMFSVDNIHIQAGITHNNNQNQYYMLLSEQPVRPQTEPSLQEISSAVLRNNSITDRLTRKENQVVELILQGHTNQEIANLMFISLSTVKSHIYQIYKKLEVNNRASLIVKLNKENALK